MGGMRKSFSYGRLSLLSLVDALFAGNLDLVGPVSGRDGIDKGI